MLSDRCADDLQWNHQVQAWFGTEQTNWVCQERECLPFLLAQSQPVWKSKKPAIFGILPVRCLQKWHGQFSSNAGHTQSFTGPCRGLSLPGVLSSQGGSLSPPEVRLWRTASAWLQCPRGRLCFAQGCVQGLRSQPGWHSHWGWKERWGALRLRAGGCREPPGKLGCVGYF